MNKKIFLIPALAFLLTACAPKTTQPTAPTTQPAGLETSSTITIGNFAYSPKEITARAGQTVTFTNKDLAGHSLTSDDGTSFDTGVIGQNQSATLTAPKTPGTYAFHCTPHPGITGTLIVE